MEEIAAKTVPVVAVAADEARIESWRELFGNDRPVEMEIGTGKGTFLVRRATEQPEINFFGIEWCNEIYKYAVDRMQRRKISNVRLMRADASLFVRTQCPANSLSVLHIYHPDPWPKKRHRKRRLVQPLFVAAAARCLVPGGRLAIQTDHAEYFEQIRAVVLAEPLLEQIEFDDPTSGVSGQRVLTNFEIKYEREGRTFYRIAMRRRV